MVCESNNDDIKRLRGGFGWLLSKATTQTLCYEKQPDVYECLDDRLGVRL